MLCRRKCKIRMSSASDICKYLLTRLSLVQSVIYYILFLLIFIADSIAARSKAWVCGRSLAGIVGSNPAGGMVVCLL